jgi:hypothetical protein
MVGNHESNERYESYGEQKAVGRNQNNVTVRAGGVLGGRPMRRQTMINSATMRIKNG